MAQDFQLTSTFSGYVNALEETNANPETLAEGSKNIIINLEGSVATRRGFYSINEGSQANGGITGSTNWSTNRGQYFMLRKWGTSLEVIIYTGDDNEDKPQYDIVTIYDDSIGSTSMSDGHAEFATLWNDTRKIDQLIITSHTEDVFWSWSGALGVVDSTTSNTITLDTDSSDVGTWGELGFPATGTVTIDGNDYDYTGGNSTDTLTGVTPDASSVTSGSYAFEKPEEHSVTGIGKVDFCGVFRNGLYLGGENSRIIRKSNSTDFTDFTASTAVGGPRELTIDDNCSGFIPSRKSMLIFGQDDSIFEQKYTISSDQTKEYFEIERLSTAAQQGVITPSAKKRIKNAVVYITADKTLDTIEFVENINEQQNVPLSDIIKNDFDNLNFHNAVIGYWQRNILVAVPNSSKIFVYDLQRKLWQAPIEYNGATVGYFSTDENGTLIGHDAFENTSYVLFNGTNDGGEAFESTAVFAYNNFGFRFNQKHFTHYVQDGYISRAGDLTRTLNYDFEGFTASEDRVFSAAESAFISNTDDSGGLGNAHLGGASLGGSELTPPSEQLRFRYADAVVPNRFFELEVVYRMDEKDANFRLVSHGANIKASENSVAVITRE